MKEVATKSNLLQPFSQVPHRRQSKNGKATFESLCCTPKVDAEASTVDFEKTPKSMQLVFLTGTNQNLLFYSL